MAFFAFISPLWAEQQRFALLVGHNEGGHDTRPLLYANHDARKMHEVLSQLGGIRPADSMLLSNPRAADVLAALAALEARIAHAQGQGKSTVFLFYYSGHAKDGDLRLGETRLSLDFIKTRLGTSPAHIRIGIIDACRSGLVNRRKGARKAPSFTVETGTSSPSQGLVLLTSASADEDAQESDTLGGSYFSHYLQTGLRGEADESRDRRITLSEAYAYAYARTVADTVDSAAGAQHPTFQFDLKGNADLVLADLTTPHEGLYVPAHAPEGLYYLVDDRGFIAAEIQKHPGRDRQIALTPGTYRVRRRLPDRLRIGTVRIAARTVTTLDENQLKDTPFSDDPVKGGLPTPTSRLSISLGGTLQSFFDRPTREDLFLSTGMLTGELTVRDFFRRGWLWGLDVAMGKARGDVQRYGSTLPFTFSVFTLGTCMGPEWSLAQGRWKPFVGVRLAFLWMHRRFEDASIPPQYFSTFSPGLATGLKIGLGKGFALLTRGRIHYLLYNVEENRSLGYWELSTEVAYDF